MVNAPHSNGRMTLNRRCRSRLTKSVFLAWNRCFAELDRMEILFFWRRIGKENHSLRAYPKTIGNRG
jgi:hypothetical protein